MQVSRQSGQAFDVPILIKPWLLKAPATAERSSFALACADFQTAGAARLQKRAVQMALQGNHPKGV